MQFAEERRFGPSAAAPRRKTGDAAFGGIARFLVSVNNDEGIGVQHGNAAICYGST